jgi:hypothetical protein
MHLKAPSCVPSKQEGLLQSSGSLDQYLIEEVLLAWVAVLASQLRWIAALLLNVAC